MGKLGWSVLLCLTVVGASIAQGAESVRSLRFAGDRDGTTKAFTLLPGSCKITIMHMGRGEFAATMLEADGTQFKDLARPVEGHFAKTVEVRIDKEAAFKIQVAASSPWTIRISHTPLPSAETSSKAQERTPQRDRRWPFDTPIPAGYRLVTTDALVGKGADRWILQGQKTSDVTDTLAIVRGIRIPGETEAARCGTVAKYALEASVGLPLGRSGLKVKTWPRKGSGGVVVTLGTSNALDMVRLSLKPTATSKARETAISAVGATVFGGKPLWLIVAGASLARGGNYQSVHALVLSLRDKLKDDAFAGE